MSGGGSPRALRPSRHSAQMTRRRSALAEPGLDPGGRRTRPPAEASRRRRGEAERVGADAHTRSGQENELRDAAVRFDLVEALESDGRSVGRMCRSLGYGVDARTFLVTYLATLCA